MRLGRTAAAAQALEEAALLDAGDPNPLLNLGLLHESAGERAEAASAFRRALERDPASTVARARLSSL
jgi:Flp pilus assembly protein TadD